MKDAREQLQLFDLIARQWEAPAAVDQVVFNQNLTAVAFGCTNGAIAIATTADASSPQSRIRRAADSAQLSIQQRVKSYPGLRKADHGDGRSTALSTHGAAGFLFGKSNGRVSSVSVGGISVRLPPKPNGPVAAAVSGSDTVAYAVGDTVHLWATDAEPLSRTVAGAVSALQFSPDRMTLACGHDAGVTLWPIDPATPPRELAFAGRPVDLVWSADGSSLACCLGPDGLAVVDIASMDCIMRNQFPAPVLSAGFGPEADFVVASGAFRAAAWTVGPESQPISTGKPGLVIVDRVAASPTRRLVAVGYANGLVSLAETGRTDEILLRQDTGAGISALAWSSDGRMLAIGGRDASAALVEFPDEMFKT